MELAKEYLAQIKQLKFVNKLTHTDLGVAKGEMTAELYNGLTVSRTWDDSRDWTDQRPITACEAASVLRSAVANASNMPADNDHAIKMIKSAAVDGLLLEDHGETNPANITAGKIGQSVGRFRLSVHNVDTHVDITQFYDPTLPEGRKRALDHIVDVISAVNGAGQ